MNRTLSEQVPAERQRVEELTVGLGRTLHPSFDHALVEIASTVGRIAQRSPSLGSEVGILAGPFVGAAVLLALGGLLKARRPRAAARALERAGLGALAPLARLLGVAELAAAVAALAVGARWTAAVVAAFYAGFSAFTARNLARGNEQGGGGCGCFGESEAPPTPLHLVVNLAATAVAGAVAAGSGGGLAEALRGQPLAGVPFLLLVAVCTGLAYAAMSVLPETIASMPRTQP